MKVKCKWALALAPFVLTGCNDLLDPGQKPVGTSGDDVLFYVAKDREARTMYQDDWDATDTEGNRVSNAIYWGNYQSDKPEYINIYCPDTERGFAKYRLPPSDGGDDESKQDVARTVVKVSDIGVQWGTKGPHTFYAFYPADKAPTYTKSSTGQYIVNARVEPGQSPVGYKYKINESEDATLTPIGNMKEYIDAEYPGGTLDGNKQKEAKTIYGMPDMEAAVMVARHDMPEDDFGNSVPLHFNVLADVLDITLNGPATPNTLGGNGNAQGEGSKSADFIQIKSVTIEVVTPNGDKVENYPVDNACPITGDFKLDMSKVAEDPSNPSEGTGNIKEMISDVEGSASILLKTGTVVEETVDKETKKNLYYPTLYVRTFSDEGTPEQKDPKLLDHLRLRAFLIPGQITKDNLNKLRIHIETDCGDYFQMLKNKDDGGNDSQYASCQIYPVKLGYFKVKSTAEFDLAHWIGQLDPNICITELSIPGAWHAAQANYQGTSDGTNVWSFQDMYNAGIRAFEVHSKNGTDKKKWGDFSQSFTFDTGKEYADSECFDPFIQSYTIENDFTNGYTLNSIGAVETKGYEVDGQKYAYRRSVEITGTVKSTKTAEAVMIPKFSLRLYRTHRNATEADEVSLSDKLIDLASIMNTDGLIFIELGMSGESAVKGVDYCRKVQVVYETGDQAGPFSGWQYSNENTTSGWNNALLKVEPTEGWREVSRTTTSTTPGQVDLDGGQAWCIAVRSCLERLKEKQNTNPDNRKNVLYSGPLDANTTIADVCGQMIAKVNTNGDSKNNEEPAFWGDTPALFSRWVGDSSKEPRTINLKWKAPVAPLTNGVSDNLHEGLRWCYTEVDNLTGWITGENINPLEVRQAAITKMNETAYKNYQGGKHRTFYLTSLGGYTGGADSPQASDCLAVSSNLHPFVLSRLSDPSRQNVPLGLVFMNYVIPPTGEEDTYKSGELIRAIINNNKAFLLHRKDEVTTPAVEDNVDSHFNNNSLSPLK